MAKSKNKEAMEKFVARLNNAVMQASGPAQMKAIGAFMIEKIAVRTRLGYGVKDNLAEKSRLKPLSKKYVEWRKTQSLPAGLTRFNRSNLTLTGSMIDSLRIKDMKKNAIRIGPTGFDEKGVSNSSKAYWQERIGRVFLRLSRQEVKQIRIFWLDQFSYLLKKEKLV